MRSKYAPVSLLTLRFIRAKDKDNNLLMNLASFRKRKKWRV